MKPWNCVSNFPLLLTRSIISSLQHQSCQHTSICSKSIVGGKKGNWRRWTLAVTWTEAHCHSPQRCGSVISFSWWQLQERLHPVNNIRQKIVNAKHINIHPWHINQERDLVISVQWLNFFKGNLVSTKGIHVLLNGGITQINTSEYMLHPRLCSKLVTTDSDLPQTSSVQSTSPCYDTTINKYQRLLHNVSDWVHDQDAHPRFLLTTSKHEDLDLICNGSQGILHQFCPI